MMNVRSAVLVLLVAALAGAACDNPPADVTQPAPVAPVTTDTFTSQVYPGGFATHTFATTATGTITVTLTSAPVVMGLGLGVPNPNFNPTTPIAPDLACVLTTVLNTPAGASPQISLPADLGRYCVTVFDVGNAPATGAIFTVSVGLP